LMKRPVLSKMNASEPPIVFVAMIVFLGPR